MGKALGSFSQAGGGPHQVWTPGLGPLPPQRQAQVPAGKPPGAYGHSIECPSRVGHYAHPLPLWGGSGLRNLPTLPSPLALWGTVLPGATALQSAELLRALRRPLVASSTCSANSTCCSWGSLARTCSSSHLCREVPEAGGTTPTLSLPTKRRAWHRRSIPLSQRSLGSNRVHLGHR